jgi:hypothetical protein
MSRTPSHPAGAARTGGKPIPPGQPATPGKAAAAPAPVPAKGSAAPVKGAAAPAAIPPKPAGLRAQVTRRQMVMGGGAAAGVALLVALFVWKPWSPTPPRLNEDPAVIAKWAATSRLHRLPFDQQRQFMELLDEKDKRVEEAYEQGMLTDQEFRRALQLGWYGEHLRKMDNFFEKPPTLRALYLDKQVDKKIRKKRKQKDQPKPDGKSALTSEEIDRDDSTEEQDVERWPAEVRQRWADYRAAFASRKQYWKDHAKEQKAAQEANNKGKQPKGDGGAVEPDKSDPAKSDPAKGAEAAAPTDQQGPQ